jgi:hypothetical protein
MALLEAARAYAADLTSKVTGNDLHAVAPLALRHRQSGFMHEYFAQHDAEERRIKRVMNQHGGSSLRGV